VTQQLVTSPEVIYDTLTGDSTFMSYVGSYVFTNSNTTLDSISILSPGQDLPRLKSVNGMEVVIHDVGPINRIDYISDASSSLVTWKCYLIAWEGATGGTLMAAMRRMIELFSGARSIEITPASIDAVGSELRALTQILVTIPENSIVIPQ
jgi:hypothetical protein